jgi:ubiquinone/menaquinone biosynthesis C-methylase UbiE
MNRVRSTGHKMRNSETTVKKEVVRKGYDEIAEEYQANRNIFDNLALLKEFSSYLPDNATILDAGCGAGVPSAKLLVQAGFEVIGVDFSANMLKIAKKNVLKATLIMEDMTKLGLKDNSFDGLVALYSIIHVPREMHASLYQSFHKILKPEGIMLICIGSDEWEGEDEYFGARMFWSEPSLEKTLQMVKNAGIQIISGKHLVIGGEKHYWIIARNQKKYAREGD